MALDSFIHNTEPSAIPNPEGDEITLYRNRNIARIPAPVGAKYIAKFSDGFEEEFGGSGSGGGFELKPARLTSLVDVNLAAAPAAFDGIAAVIGDRILINNQVDQTQNGVYDFNGVGNPMTRSSDFTTGSNPTPTAGMLIVVTEGNTLADTIWEVQTPDGDIVFGVSLIKFKEVSFDFATYAQAIAGTDSTKAMTPERTRNAIQGGSFKVIFATQVANGVYTAPLPSGGLQALEDWTDYIVNFDSASLTAVGVAPTLQIGAFPAKEIWKFSSGIQPIWFCQNGDIAKFSSVRMVYSTFVDKFLIVQRENEQTRRTNKCIFVDPEFGEDQTATRDRESAPCKTVDFAESLAINGDTIVIKGGQINLGQALTSALPAGVSDITYYCDRGSVINSSIGFPLLDTGVNFQRNVKIKGSGRFNAAGVGIGLFSNGSTISMEGESIFCGNGMFTSTKGGSHSFKFTGDITVNGDFVYKPLLGNGIPYNIISSARTVNANGLGFVQPLTASQDGNVFNHYGNINVAQRLIQADVIDRSFTFNIYGNIKRTVAGVNALIANSSAFGTESLVMNFYGAIDDTLTTVGSVIGQDASASSFKQLNFYGEIVGGKIVDLFSAGAFNYSISFFGNLKTVAANVTLARLVGTPLSKIEFNNNVINTGLGIDSYVIKLAAVAGATPQVKLSQNCKLQSYNLALESVFDSTATPHTIKSFPSCCANTIISVTITELISNLVIDPNVKDS